MHRASWASHSLLSVLVRDFAFGRSLKKEESFKWEALLIASPCFYKVKI